MTDKEKAKAYDEAFEKAREKYNSKYHPSEGPSGVYLNNVDLEEIFPALKESEDERIRKGLIELIENWNYPQELFTTKRNIIAYLEKQKEPIDPFDTKLFQDGVKEGRRLEREDIKKEQQSVENISQLIVKGKGVYKICPHCKSRMIRDDSKVYTSMPPQYGYNCPKCGTIEFDTVMYDSPEMKEQKPADDEAKAIAYREYERGRESGLRDGQKYVLDNAESYGLCKPTEWSEDIIRKAVKEVGLTQHQIDWFKTNVFPPKQEWSEEDERILKGIIGLIDHDQHYGVSNKEMISWLKDRCPSKDCSSCAKHLEGYISGRSDAENKLLVQFGALVTPEGELHIKPRWKPSEEQMEALRLAIPIVKNCISGMVGHAEILESLDNGLKKLM